jgi:hypothetical protein
VGLRADIYRGTLGDCSNGGISGRVDRVTIVNAGGPFEPADDAPAVELRQGAFRGIVIAVPVDEQSTERASREIGPMAGGCYVATSDSRFGELCRRITGTEFYGAVPLHDRFETQELYDALSR